MTFEEGLHVPTPVTLNTIDSNVLNSHPSFAIKDNSNNITSRCLGLYTYKHTQEEQTHIEECSHFA